MSNNQETQIKQDIEQLSQTLVETRAELKELPEAIAQETSKALTPLQTMQDLLPQIAEAFDQVEATQRDSLQQLSEEMVSMSTKELQNTVQPIKESLQQLNSTTKELRALHPELLAMTAQLQTTSDQLSAQIAAQRKEQNKPLWRRALVTAAISVTTALVILIGQAALEPTKADPDTQADAQWARQIWSKANEQERALLMQIVTRPAP